MSFMKDLFMDACEEIASEAEEAGIEMSEDEVCEKAYQASIAKFALMCDAAKDRAKYL